MREGPFDDVASFVGCFVERMKVLARGVLSDDRRGPASRQERAKGIAVVGGIGEQRRRRRQPFDQSGGGANVVSISTGQLEPDDPAIAVDDGVDFRGASASALADGLSVGPPFPPAAHRWAFAVVLSMH